MAGEGTVSTMLLDWIERRRRRRHLRSHPEVEWRSSLLALPFVAHHPMEDVEHLMARAQELEGRVSWEGCAGMQIERHVVHTIALQAARLVLRLDDEHYDHVEEIHVYPSGFDALDLEHRRVHAAGLAVQDGPVLLAWDHAWAGGQDPTDGRNVVYHEFAHVLDMRDGVIDGIPLQRTEHHDRVWRHALRRGVRQLRGKLRRGQPTALRAYGASHPAEFFAEATEVFFERPRDLRAYKPGVYRALQRYYRQDPAR